MVDVVGQFQVLLRQEATFYKTTDYLSRLQESGSADGSVAVEGSSKLGGEGMSSNSPKVCAGSEKQMGPSGSSSPQMSKHWREKICEWAYQVVDHFELHREVVSIAMNYLDRYIATLPRALDKDTFQLLAMTCLYLAVKLNEYKHLYIPDSKSSMDTILRLSRGLFTIEQMEKMEVDILQRLQWHVHPPTPQLFCKHLLHFLSVEEYEYHDLSQFMVELSVMDYFFVTFKPSEIAAAGVMNALECLNPSVDPRGNFPFDISWVDVDSPAIRACRERLALIFAQTNDQLPRPHGMDGPAKRELRRTTSPVSVMATAESAPCRSTLGRHYH
eukprot:Nitzschia sp. Nitz4//scaffold48_size128905//50884//51941//NITZ4_003594-RA/size128905-processed-gene-0.80-mRNA-1//1//CDS//3329552964//8890//frame0